MSDLALNLLIQAQDQASGVIKNVGAAFGPVGSLIAGAAAALVGFTAQSIQTASQFQSSMNMVQALTGATTQQMAQYSTGIKQLASDTGVAATQLTDGLYFMTSAGYSGADALKMLTLSTKDAVIGQTDAKTTANALATVMRGFSIDISHADQVNGEMLRTVTAGKMTMADYASSISKTSSVAMQYHDTMENMNAVLATLTSNGIKNANVAGTDYNNLLKVLNGNTLGVIEKSKALNPAFNGNAFAAMDVAGKVDYLNKMIIQHGHNITDVIGKQQNAAAAFTVLSQHSADYAKNLKNLSDQQANANATQNAWAITQQGLQVSMNRMQASLQNLMIDLGNAFLPILTKIMDAVSTVISNFVTWEEKTHFIQNALDALGKALTPIWDALQKLGGAIANVWSSVAPIFETLASDAQGWGANLMGGFIDGISSMLGGLTSMLDSIATEISNFLGFASPSKKGKGKNLMKWGPAMIASFAQGISSSAPLVENAIGDVTKHFDKLKGDDDDTQKSGASAAGSSFVNIGSALQSVSLGHPLGASAAPSATTASPTVSALSKVHSALGANTTALATSTAKHTATAAATASKHAATVAAASAKHTAAVAKHAQVVAASAAKHAAAVVKSQQSATAAAARLSATQTKAVTASNSPAVQALVNQSKAAAAAGNMAMARLYASQALQLADQQKAAANKAAKASAKGGGIGGGPAIPSVNENSILGKFKIPDVGKQVSDSIAKVGPTISNHLKSAIGSGAFKAIGDAIKTIGQLATNLNPAIGLFQALSRHAQELGKWFQTSVIPAVKQAEPGFKNLMQAILGLLPALNQIALVMKNTFQKAFDSMLPVYERAIPIIIKVAGAIADNLGSAIKFLTPFVVQAATAIGQFMSDLAARIAPLIMQFMDFLSKAVQPFLAIWPGIVLILKGVWMEIVGVIKVAWAGLTGFFKIALDLFAGNWKQAWTDLVDTFKGIWDGIVTFLQGAWSILQGVFSVMFNGIKAYFVGLYNDLVGHSIVPDMINGIVNWFKQMPGRVATEIQNMITGVMNLLNGLSTQVFNAGANIVNQIANGITSAIGAIGNAMNTVTNFITSHLPHSPAKIGPLRELHERGEHISKELGEGMEHGAHHVAKAAAAIAKQALPALAVANYIHTAAGVALPNYDAGTGQTIADVQPVAASNNSSVTGGAVHIHVHLGDSDGDARKHGQKVAEEVKKQLGKMTRGQAITPRYTSGGTR